MIYLEDRYAKLLKLVDNHIKGFLYKITSSMILKLVDNHCQQNYNDLLSL